MLGWVLFGLVNSVTDDLNVLFAWVLVWLLPVLVLAGGSLVTHLRVKECDRQLVEAERQP